MKSYKLGEIASFFQGKQVDLENQFLNKDENHNVRFVRIVDYTNSDEPMRYIENLGEKYYARECDLVMIRYGSQTAGKVVMGKSGIIANNMFKINLDNTVANNEFMYYYLSQPHIFDYLRRAQSSSTMPAINFGMLNNFEVMIPNIDIQEKIVSILKKLDDRIKINTQINDNLLELINNLYKESFSNIEEYKQADEIANITIGKTPPRSNRECFTYNEDDIKWLSISDLGKCGMYAWNTSEKLTEDAVNKYNVKVIPENTIVLSFKLTIGRIAITANKMATNEAIAHFNLIDNDMIYYLYSYLKNFDYSKLGNTSSIATAVNSKIIKAMPIGVPDKTMILEFNNKVKPLFEKIKLNETQNETLTQLRDTLLPKLMNGEIDLDKIEI